jgi:hypothetical protein
MRSEPKCNLCLKCDQNRIAKTRAPTTAIGPFAAYAPFIRMSEARNGFFMPLGDNRSGLAADSGGRSRSSTELRQTLIGATKSGMQPDP